MTDDTVVRVTITAAILAFVAYAIVRSTGKPQP